MIETERLILRKWKYDDIDEIVEGLNNFNVSKWLGKVPFPYTKEDAKNYIDHANKTDNSIELAIVLKEENKVIGGTCITLISKIDGVYGGGIWLNEKYHGKGYGTEAFNAKSKYCF